MYAVYGDLLSGDPAAFIPSPTTGTGHPAKGSQVTRLLGLKQRKSQACWDPLAIIPTNETPFLFAVHSSTDRYLRARPEMKVSSQSPLHVSCQSHTEAVTSQSCTDQHGSRQPHAPKMKVINDQIECQSQCFDGMSRIPGAQKSQVAARFLHQTAKHKKHPFFQ